MSWWSGPLAAFVIRRGKRLLILGLARKAEAVDMEGLIKALPWAGIERVISLPHTPLDGRHNAKIDCPALLADLAVR